jgi:hypothetical protein
MARGRQAPAPESTRPSKQPLVEIFTSCFISQRNQGACGLMGGLLAPNPRQPAPPASYPESSASPDASSRSQVSGRTETEGCAASRVPCPFLSAFEGRQKVTTQSKVVQKQRIASQREPRSTPCSSRKTPPEQASYPRIASELPSASCPSSSTSLRGWNVSRPRCERLTAVFTCR